MNRSWLTRFAWISIVAALFTIILKTAAYGITGSVGLLSDAIESVVNLIGGIMALSMLTVAARHGVKAITESFPMAKVNDAVARLKKNQVRYRAVLGN